MTTLDERVQEILGRVESYLESQGYRRNRRGTIEFPCPAHEDHEKHAWLREYAWGCFVCGKSVDPKLISLAEHLGLDVGFSAPRGYLLANYADEKGFSLDKLQQWGVVEVENPDNGLLSVGFRNCEPDGTLVRTQCRGKGGRQWWANDGTGVFPYGLDFLAHVPVEKPVVLVEGTSDVHALFHMKLAAVGIPGANTWKRDWEKYFLGRDKLYVWKEPGSGGQKFIEAVVASFPNIRILEGGRIGAKDPADLMKQFGITKARAKIQEAMERAAPVHLRELVVGYGEISGANLVDLGEQLKRPIEAIPTPFPTWNQACGMFGGRVGLPRGSYTIIGGAVGQGKTFTSIQMAVHAAMNGYGVAFHSLEMPWNELALRAISQLSQVPITDIEPGRFHKPEAFEQARQRTDELLALAGGAIYTNKRQLVKLEDLVDAIRYQFEVNGCWLHIIDYLQLAWTGGRNQEHEVTVISHTLRALIKDLGIAGVGLSQLNREATKNRIDSPKKESLYGGQALEADSDQTVLLDHSKFEINAEGWATWLDVDKNRHGPRVRIPIQFSKRTLSIRERQPDEVKDSEVASDIPKTNGRKR